MSVGQAGCDAKHSVLNRTHISVNAKAKQIRTHEELAHQEDKRIE